MNETLLGGRYELLEAIASGGEARVFRALDIATRNEVAARLPLHPNAPAAPAALPSFHPGWVRLIETGTDPQLGPCQIFELLEGPTLSQRIKSGPLEQDAWRDFVSQSLAAVEALHAAGWIHGDLNADNFLLAGPRWKLLELPFLRFTPPAHRSLQFGSIHTLPPEQIDNAPPDARSDLYALGCLYYFAACGKFPHESDSIRQIAFDRLLLPAEPLSEKSPALPAAWSAAVMSLLARNPGDRPANVAEARYLLGIA